MSKRKTFSLKIKVSNQAMRRAAGFLWPRRKGQSLVELTLIFTLMLIILSGLTEFGFWMLDYSSLVMAARNGARFAVDNDHSNTHNACQGTRSAVCDPLSPAFDVDVCKMDFYCKVAWSTQQSLEQSSPPIHLDPDRGDDIVVSVLTFTQDDPDVITSREPEGIGYWSYFGVRGTSMDNDKIKGLLTSQGLTSTSAGYVLVEVYYVYPHKLGLPWLKAFVPDPLPLYTYVVMPLYSAAPTPTPAP